MQNKSERPVGTPVIVKELKTDIKPFIICRFNEDRKKLEKTGIQLVGKCVDLLAGEENILLICVQNEDRFSVHRFRLRSIESLFNLSLLAVRRYSNFYTSKEPVNLIDQLPEKLQTFRFD